MKKINYIKIVFIFFITFLCSGCVKFDGEVKINNTKSMNMMIIYAVDKKVINGDAISNDDRSFLKKNGFDISDYKNGNFEGVTLKYKIKNIDKVSSNKDTNFSITSIKYKKIDNIFKLKKGWFKNKYKANFIFDATDVNNDFNYSDDNIEYLCNDGKVITITEYDEVPADCFYATKVQIENAKSDEPLSDEELEKKISENIDLKFKVKLANGSIKNNAITVSKNKKELVWKLSDNGITDMNFEFELYNYFNIFITIICCLISLFILFVIFIFFKRKFRRIKVKLRRRRQI